MTNLKTTALKGELVLIVPKRVGAGHASQGHRGSTRESLKAEDVGEMLGPKVEEMPGSEGEQV